MGIKLLISRIDDLNQYNAQNKVLEWKDETPNRWISTYNMVEVGYYAMFIGKGKVYIGEIAKITFGSKITVKYVEEFKIENDQVLQLNEIYPEYISRCKASFHPFIHPFKINVIKLKKDIINRNFISYYVVSNLNIFYDGKFAFKDNDRIVEIKNGLIENIYLKKTNDLIEFNHNDNFNIIGLSLNDLLKINQNYKSEKSNNVRRIKTIINELDIKGIYKFNSFFAYHDALFNARAYGNLDTLQVVKELEDYLVKNEVMKKNIALNQILYGPPGTGKTYKTLSKALEIINDKEVKALNFSNRNEVKSLFDKKLSDGQIIFTTFHQSMSYEDFIEGIKPVKPDEDEKFIKYKVESGIFKLACANAAYFCYKKYKELNKKELKYSFNELHDAFIDHIQTLINIKTPPVYKTLKGKEITVIKITSTKSIKARALNSVATRNPAPLTKENLEKLYDKFSSINEIKSLKQVEETVEVTPRITEFYAIFKALKEFEQKEFKPDLNYNEEIIDVENLDFDEKIVKFESGVYSNAVKDYGKLSAPVVLIIDEINRGNVSQIFGELITLIEEDKRLGNNESLEIILPYSKKKFSVPSNLYIIGTMNTADRSVEALDTALRRRFSFEELPPKYDLKELENEVYGYPLKDILETINKRIVRLLNNDHAIGHSYFLNKDEDSIIESFKRNIIPLLQEYFFGDYGKMMLVLGDGFVTYDEWKDEEKFFASYTESKNDYDVKDLYSIKNYKTEEKEGFAEALKKLMNK